MGNVSKKNHAIHFLLGLLSTQYSYITGAFLLYQLVDGFKFRYRVVLDAGKTDDIPMDLVFFAIGALLPRIWNNKKQ